MVDDASGSPPARVKCETCLREIPRSEATSVEAEEYTLYFCGIDCYQRWRRQGDNDGHTDGNGS
ncbi:MAG TPA: DUF3330 domain-containing protein [Gammaproteobacteria bacterium]|nr:DUF3330 domain-containing protein [Gammaproteobacteria bacterium]